MKEYNVGDKILYEGETYTIEKKMWMDSWGEYGYTIGNPGTMIALLTSKNFQLL